MKFISRTFVGLCFLALGSSAAVAAPGQLDTSFDTDGIAQIPPAVVRGMANGVATDASNRVVVGGQAIMADGAYQCLVARFTEGGSLDVSFDSDGWLTLPPPPGSDMVWCSAKPQAAGGKTVVLSGGNSGNGSLIRLNNDGSRDASFGGGEVGLDYSPGGLTVNAEGVATVVGTKGSRLMLSRFDAGGNPLSSFGGGSGEASADFGGETPSYNHLVETSDGKIIVAGRLYNGSGKSHPVLARFNTDGTPDATFAAGSKESGPFEPGRSYPDVDAVAIQNIGGQEKILIAGHYYCGADDDERDCAYIARFLADGTSDAEFGRAGMVFPFAQYARDLAVQRNGKILFAGIVSGNGVVRGYGELARYTANGAPDGSFGGGGSVRVMSGSGLGVESPEALALDMSGKILVGGYALPGNQDFTLTLARYWGDLSIQPPVRINNLKKYLFPKLPLPSTFQGKDFEKPFWFKK